MINYINGCMNETTEIEPEIWTAIVGYEGQYEVSSYGRIISLYFGYKIRAIHINSNGYYFVKLSKNGLQETIDVHILVARHFIPNPLNLKEVNHLKGKLNNYYKDLEWTTPSDNQLHAYRTGLKKKLKHEENPKAILNRAQVLQIVDSAKTLRELSAIYNVSQSAINHIRNGYSWTEITGKYPGWKKNL